MEPEVSKLPKGLLYHPKPRFSLSHLDSGSITSRAQLCRSMILSCLSPDQALKELTSHFLVGHPSWECFRVNLLNFVVPIESEASELPKGLVLGLTYRIGLIIRKDTPLSLSPSSSLSSQIVCSLHPTSLATFPCLPSLFCPLATSHPPSLFRSPAIFLLIFPTIFPRSSLSHLDPGFTSSIARLRRSMILFSLGPDHTFTVLFLGTHEQLPSGSPILGMLLHKLA
ncbi:hypothetical protein DVH24_030066 [Malus domestica]|uniref:Uncharacterized protein n=1 Tax=Malus domestica TaxID=3750 RepID=A0A498I0B8_MALDO|nr:hypothetical protein DVH24_030066 [Malus domestica]